MRTIHLCGLLLLGAGSGVALAEDHAATNASTAIVTPIATQKLADYPGKEVLMLSVEYPPGSADPVHRHDAEAFVYVLEGSIVMGVNGGQPVTLIPGQTFHEEPHDVHTIGRNASKEKPAKFVVFLLKDSDKPALIPAG
jgi:quercetin dioxygenase-like cupin family protein